MPSLQYQSIAEVILSLNRSFEKNFPEVLFQGEIAEITHAQSGHIYFTVKDENAQLSAVMWRSGVSMLRFRPAAGMAVMCHGRPNIYQKNGRFQVVVNRMIPTGEGALQQRFNELKAKLEKEGLFAIERKRSIPLLPKGVGVVTSKTGAVIHDIMVKIQERFPSIPVYLADARVQGPGAAKELVRGLELCNQCPDIDVIILARGGGSLEDLWQFNEEIVVRAVFASSLPVVSGVGHEVDVTLCDLAADLRAPTPTAAAEMVVPLRSDLLFKIEALDERLKNYDRWLNPSFQQLDELSMRLERTAANFVARARLTLKMAMARVRVLQPNVILSERSRDLGGFSQRLRLVSDRFLKEAKMRFERCALGWKEASPITTVEARNREIIAYRHRLVMRTDNNISRKRDRLIALEERLTALDPHMILSRGFSIVRRHGEVVREGSQLLSSDEISVELHKGSLDAVVKKINN